MSEFAYLFIMAVLVFCAGWGAYLLVMKGRRRIYLAFLLGIALLGGYFAIRMDATQGWNSVGYMLFLLIFIAPALAGMVIGGVIGLIRNSRHG